MTRDLKLLVSGTAISVAGDAVAVIALTLRLRPEGAGWVAALLATELVPPVLLAPFAGRLVDRVETRSLLIAMMSLQALVAVPLAFVSPPWAVVALAALLGCVSAVVGPASGALVPAVAGPDDTARAYRMIGSAVGLGYVIGPGLGGVLADTVGTTPAVLLDSASFGVLALSRLLITARRHPDPAVANQPLGPNPVWQNRQLTAVLAGVSITMACAVVDNVAAPFRFVNELHASPSVFGLYLTIWSVGVVIGSPLTGRLGPPERALALGCLVIGAGIAGIGVAPVTGLALGASLIGGVGNGVLSAAQGAVISGRTPAAQHGRAFATAGAVVTGGLAVGTLLGPVLVDALSAGHAMAGAGLVTVVLAGVLLALRLGSGE